MTEKCYQWHSIAETFTRICEGQTPWVALGDFLNDWWFFATDQRQALTEVPLPSSPTPELHRWAAFCAATVEWLCTQDELPIPGWVDQEQFILKDPWYLYENWAWRPRLIATTPAAFKMRNIYGGGRMFQHVPHRSWQLTDDVNKDEASQGETTS
jgi:hypothetical protein